MRSKEEIIATLNELEHDIVQHQEEASRKKLEQIGNRLNANAKKLLHSQKAAAYLTFKESEAYILGLKEEIQSSGIQATDQLTKDDLRLAIADDAKTALTFDRVRTGAVLKSAKGTFLVKSVAPSPAGTEVSLTPANTSATISSPEQQTRPYGPVPFRTASCNWDSSHKQMTVAALDAPKQGEVITIAGISYRPAFLVGSTTGPIRTFELEEIQPDQQPTSASK